MSKMNRSYSFIPIVVFAMLLSGTTARALAFEVQEFCGLSSKGTLGVSLNIHLSVGEKAKLKSQYVHISCADGKCRGFRTNGNYWESEAMEGLRIESIDPAKAVLSWGMTEFTLDKESKKFVWKTSDGGYGVADCPSVFN